ncbi:MAG: hypothetical protein JW804_00180 [Sedimentisphaerales bacterium]|nr:hypothetical protein [Sedimentisphaerales bacterium]
MKKMKNRNSKLTFLCVLVLIRVNSWLIPCGFGTYDSTFVERPLQITPFFTKQSQLSSILAQKRRFQRKTNPKQSQFKPKRTQNKAKQSQYLSFVALAKKDEPNIYPS